MKLQFLILKMEAAWLSETSVAYGIITWCHNRELIGDEKCWKIFA